MKFRETQDHIVRCYLAGLRQTMFLVGPPGIGKTACPRAAALAIARDRNLTFVDMAADPHHRPGDGEFCFRAYGATTIDPLDVGGVVAVLDRQQGDGPYAARLPLEELVPRSGAGIVVYDDLPTAPALTQAALFRPIWERAGIGADWQIIATGNRAGDRAGVNPILTPLVSKMAWINFEVSADEWLLHQSTRSPSSVLVRAFIKSRPDLFVTFDPAVPGPFATARTWEALGDLLAQVYRDDGGSLPHFDILQGWIGEGPAREFHAFATMAAQLVDPDEVIADPQRAPVPDEPGPLWAVATALSARLNHGTCAPILTYLGRCPNEFAIYAVSSALAAEKARVDALPSADQRAYRRLASHPAFAAFARANVDLLTV